MKEDVMRAIRRVPKFLIVAATLLTVTSWNPHARQPQAPPGQVPLLDPGAYDQTLQRTDATPVRYAISIPKGYSSSRPVPLVLALHFGGPPKGAGMGLLTVLVGPALAELGAVIVAPDSLGGGWSTPENARAGMALMDAVQATYRIDPKRIVVTGFSMGGAGVWHFAGKYPDRFTAAVPVAGRPPTAIRRGGRRSWRCIRATTRSFQSDPRRRA
jgi:poly(3-hydroxybutyrate) depolymerase